MVEIPVTLGNYIIIIQYAKVLHADMETISHATALAAIDSIQSANAALPQECFVLHR